MLFIMESVMMLLAMANVFNRKSFILLQMHRVIFNFVMLRVAYNTTDLIHVNYWKDFIDYYRYICRRMFFIILQKLARNIEPYDFSLTLFTKILSYISAHSVEY